MSGKPSVCIVGAGFSGICAAIRLKTELGYEDLDIYEANKNVGGTWFSNRYPGCACDIPIHAYTFSFERRADWRAQYANDKEIREYLEECASKYDLYSHTHFQHSVNSAIWQETDAQWEVAVTNLTTGQQRTKKYQLLFVATGSLRVPKYPPEFQAFQGELLHSAEWNDNISLQGKKVAVVGTGASAVQVVPEVAKAAKELYVFQRKPSWTIPKLDFTFGGWLKWLFGKAPFLLAFYQWLLLQMFELLYLAMKKDSVMNGLVTRWANSHRWKQLGGREDLYEALTPKYRLGCQRTTFAQNFYPCFTLPHVRLVTQKIAQVDNHAITTQQGERIHVDVLILCTGFEVTDYFGPLQLWDKRGANVLAEWRQHAPQLFLGMLSHTLPNAFIIYGPNTSTGHTSVIVMIEQQMELALRILRQKERLAAKTFAVQETVVQSYMQQLQQQLTKMVWSAAHCSPWYADSEGRIVGLFPWDMTKLRKIVKNFNPSKSISFHK